MRILKETEELELIHIRYAGDDYSFWCPRGTYRDVHKLSVQEGTRAALIQLKRVRRDSPDEQGESK